jgi:hypothetical protein
MLLIALVFAVTSPDGIGCESVARSTLELNERSFDQDERQGWRPLARPGCFVAAADLIAAWRQRHPEHGPMLYFHEAQMRAAGGQYAAAAPLFAKARSGPNEWRIDTGWNHYIDASIAFVRRDLPALRSARATLASLPIPAEQPGVAEAAKAEPRPESWPPNIDVVDGLIRCFEKGYADALQGGCRTPARQ